MFQKFHTNQPGIRRSENLEKKPYLREFHLMAAFSCARIWVMKKQT